jgi:hypothetical protein
MDSPQAIRTGVAAADDDHALAGRKNLDCRVDRVSETAFVLLGEKLHRVVNPLELACRNCQITRLLGTAGENNRIEIAA